MNVRCRAGVVLSLLWAAFLVGAVRAEPDEGELGKAEGYARGTAATMFAERFKVGSFTATDKILPTREVGRAGPVAPLETGPAANIAYQFRGTRYTLADYLERRRATGLLVLKDGRIVAEHYRYGRSANDRFLSFSMAKSVTSLLFGIAIGKGLIGSLDDPAEKYVAELRGSAYGQATVGQLLRMSSGVKFVEEYNGRDDMARLSRAQRGLSHEKPLTVLASFNERVAPPGEKLGYSSAETAVLGYVLARAANNNVAELTSQWIWQPLGAEANAAWNLGADGQERCEGSFNATLRDFGRLGLLLANDGRVGQTQIVPRSYLLEATDAARQTPAFRPGTATTYFGYGRLFWLFPIRSRTFALLGIYGQGVFVQPESKIVMVHTAAWKDPRDNEAAVERDALWRGVLASLGGQTAP
jgi:CubicO group peptidase (beta-lactamase class C family)